MISLPTLRIEVWTHLGQDENDTSSDDLDLLLNRTYWEILEKFNLRETESSSTFFTIAGRRDYPLPPSFESLRITAIKDLNSGQHKKLDAISVKEYENFYSEDAEEQGEPTRYFRGGSDIIFWKTPDDVYTITLHYRMQLSDLTDSNVNPQLPKSWQELLIMGATARGFYRVSDLDKAERVQKYYVNLLNSMIPVESKEEWDRSEAGVQVRGREY